MRRRYWIAGVVAVVAVAAAGSAVAATKFQSPKAESKAIINDAAGRLHVTPGALSSALKRALADRVDAAVAAGRLTKKQGEALKARINAGRAPIVGPFGFGFGGRHFGDRGFGDHDFGFHHRGGMLHGGFHGGMLGAGLRVVASYLGLTNAQLRSALGSGKSLAQIAKAHGKTADGLVAALVAAAKTRLDKAVTAKHLTAAKEKTILSKLQSFFKSMVSHKPPAWSQQMGHHAFGFGSSHRFWTPSGKKTPPSFKPSALPAQQA
jgi:hypothetical protein